MGGKFTEKVYLRGVEKELEKLLQGQIVYVGVTAKEGSELAIYAAVQEFGATITPKKGKFLAVP